MFIHADVHALRDSALTAFLANCARPLMVVDDGPHTFDGCRSVMEFFHDYLQPGEYLVVEDGILNDLGYRRLRNGPNRAIRWLLNEYPHSYEVDRAMCDFFGRNVTWNPNGYLVRQ